MRLRYSVRLWRRAYGIPAVGILVRFRRSRIRRHRTLPAFVFRRLAYTTIVDQHDTQVPRDELEQLWRLALDSFVEQVLSGHERLSLKGDHRQYNSITWDTMNTTYMNRYRYNISFKQIQRGEAFSFFPARIYQEAIAEMMIHNPM